MSSNFCNPILLFEDFIFDYLALKEQTWCALNKREIVAIAKINKENRVLNIYVISMLVTLYLFGL